MMKQHLSLVSPTPSPVVDLSSEQIDSTQISGGLVRQLRAMADQAEAGELGEFKGFELDVDLSDPDVLELLQQAQGGGLEAPEQEMRMITVEDLSQMIMEIPNPVRDVAAEVREAIGTFINSNVGAKGEGIGFTHTHNSQIPASELLEVLNSASESLEDIFINDNDRTALAVSMRTFAQRLQGGVDSFRVFMAQEGYGQGVPTSSVSGFLQSCVQLKGEVSSVIQELDGYLFEHAMMALQGG